MSDEKGTIERGLVSFPAGEVTPMSEKTMESIIDSAEKNVALYKKMVDIAIRLTNPRDWVDQGGSPYLMGSGAEKIKNPFGVHISGVTSKKDVSTDDLGDYYLYTFQGTASVGGVSIECIGTCSSRDQFFAYQHGELKPDSQIDEGNVKKAAYTNFTTNAITRLLGLRNLTWAQIETAGIKKADVGKVEYRKNSLPEEKLKPLREMILKIVDNDNAKAQDLLEKYTSFQKGNETVKGKRKLEDISEGQYPVVLEKAKKELEAKEKAKATPPAAAK